MLEEHEAFEFVRRDATEDPRGSRADCSVVEAEVLEDFEAASARYVGRFSTRAADARAALGAGRDALGRRI